MAIFHRTWSPDDVESLTILSGTLDEGDRLLIYELDKQHYYGYCQASEEQAKKWNNSHVVYELVVDGRIEYLGFAWLGPVHEHGINYAQIFPLIEDDIMTVMCDKYPQAETVEVRIKSKPSHYDRVCANQ